MKLIGSYYLQIIKKFTFLRPSYGDTRFAKTSLHELIEGPTVVSPRVKMSNHSSFMNHCIAR